MVDGRGDYQTWMLSRSARWNQGVAGRAVCRGLSPVDLTGFGLQLEGVGSDMAVETIGTMPMMVGWTAGFLEREASRSTKSTYCRACHCAVLPENKLHSEARVINNSRVRLLHFTFYLYTIHATPQPALTDRQLLASRFPSSRWPSQTSP